MSARFGIGRGPEANPAWVGGTSEPVTLSVTYLASLFNGLYSGHKQGPALGHHSYPYICTSH